MARSRVAVWTGGRAFTVEERPVPEPGPGEVRVAVHSCGVCMTEVHSLEGYFTVREPPFVLGHEWGGVVEAVGPGVAGVSIGTRVAGSGMGGYADHVVLAADRVFPLPTEARLDEAAFVEPLACLIEVVKRGQVPPGSSALITGAGPMGLMLLQLVRRAGARVLVSEPAAARRELARELGAEQAIDPTRESLADAVAAFTDGQGVATAFETAGHPAPLGQCLEALAVDGTAVVVGVAPASTRLDLGLYPFHRRNLTLRGVYGGSDFAAAAKLLGTLELQPIVSHRVGLAGIAEGFETARTGRGLKVLVEMGL